MSTRALLVGATGTIGSAVAAALRAEAVEVVSAARSGADESVDLSDPGDVRAMLARVGTVDAIVSCAGAARFVPLLDATDEDWSFSLTNKLMGQINLVRFGAANVRDGGSITLTTGVLAERPMPGSSIISTVNAGLQGFVRSAGLELTALRVNAVSPGWVAETLSAMGKDPSAGIPAAQVAQAYVRAMSTVVGGEIVPAHP